MGKGHINICVSIQVFFQMCFYLSCVRVCVCFGTRICLDGHGRTFVVNLALERLIGPVPLA